MGRRLSKFYGGRRPALPGTGRTRWNGFLGGRRSPGIARMANREICADFADNRRRFVTEILRGRNEQAESQAGVPTTRYLQLLRNRTNKHNFNIILVKEMENSSEESYEGGLICSWSHRPKAPLSQEKYIIV